LNRRIFVFCCAVLLTVCGFAVPAWADTDSQQTCTSGTTWIVVASWGDAYTDPAGVVRRSVKVRWTSTGSTLTEWEVRSFNGDGSVANTLRGQDRWSYGDRTSYRTVDAADPTGSGASVRVRVGVAQDGKADCLLSFPAPASSGPGSPPVSPPPTPTAAPTAAPASGRVLFEDDFSAARGTSFDHTKWQDWSACSYHSSAAFGRIMCGDSETHDGQGHLQIPATPTAGSALSTATKFGFVYGQASAWIKVPASDGYWPAFWTLNAEPTCCAAKTLPVGELDVMEQYTTWDTLYHRAFHAWNNDQTWHGGIATCGNVDLTAAFHKYSVRVEPGRVTYFLDNVQCGQPITKELGQGRPYPFVPDLMDPNFLILDLAVGGAGGAQKPATQPAVLLVDRVEVRAL